jgi:sugar-specific transcriptional regulator TrmB
MVRTSVTTAWHFASIAVIDFREEYKYIVVRSNLDEKLPFMIMQKELKKLGLKDKEAAVYLACLELGSAPVQKISRKARVVRATTYVVLNALAQKGLVTQFKEGKKTLFSAEPPLQLTRLIEKREERLQEQKKELNTLLPELQALMKAGQGIFVRYFEGTEGLRAMRQEMVMYTSPGDIWYHFSPIDHLEAVFGREETKYSTQRVAKGIRSKTIFTTKSEKLKEELMATAVGELAERRFVSPDDFPSASGMTIFRNRIAIGSFTGKIGGVIIESDAIADMHRRLFELAWSGTPATKS